MDFHFEYLYDLKNEDLELNSLKEKREHCRLVLYCAVLYCIMLYCFILFYFTLFYSILTPLGTWHLMGYQDIDDSHWELRLCWAAAKVSLLLSVPCIHAESRGHPESWAKFTHRIQGSAALTAFMTFPSHGTHDTL